MRILTWGDSEELVVVFLRNSWGVPQKSQLMPASSHPSRLCFPTPSPVVLQDLGRGACQGRTETAPISTTVPRATVTAAVAATEVDTDVTGTVDVAAVIPAVNIAIHPPASTTANPAPARVTATTCRHHAV